MPKKLKYTIIISRMDEEKEGSSLGAYENMDRSDIRPDFFDDWKNDGEAAEDSEAAGAASNISSNASSFAKNILKDKENKAAKGAAEKVASKVGGAKAKAAMKVADKVGGKNGGGLSSFTGKGKGKGKLKLNGKKALPLIIILLVLILVWAVASFVGQWLFPVGFKSRTMEDWNSTKTSNNKRTDTSTEEQLGCGTDSDDPSKTVYDKMNFTEAQIESFEKAGLSYKKSEDGKNCALTFTNKDGKENIITSDASVSKRMSDGKIADGGDAVGDAGTDGISEEEAKQQIVAALNESPDANVMTFSQAMGDSDFKQKYTTATKYWRGDTSGWFTQTTDTVMKRLGVSRNNYKDFTLSGDNQKNTEEFLEITKSKTAASEGGDLGDKSLSERVSQVAQSSKNTSCGTTSAFNDIESVVATDQTARQVSAGSLWLEAIDKTMAGEGEGAPLTAVTNIVVNSGGATTAGMSTLFGNTVLNQSDEMVQSVSAQAHGNGEAITSNENIYSDQYRGCVYVGDLNEQGASGAIVSVGSLFKMASDWISKMWDSAKNIIAVLKNGGNYGATAISGSSSGIVDSALSSTVDAYNSMKEQTYFNGEDTKLIGEALVTSSERIMNEKAKSAGQVVGDETNLLANYRAQQEIIAEQAEYERSIKSPFDISSPYTFLGSIAHSLIPFAVTTQSTALTSTVSNVGTIVSNSINKLLPTSDAVSEAQVSRGDCVLSNNIGAVSNPHCNNYYDSDLQLAETNAKDLYNSVAALRYDKHGYEIRTDVSKSDPRWGDKPLSEAEGNSCVLYNDKGQKIGWSYAIHPNFEYVGYKTGWHNRTSANTTPGIEQAKNDIEPTKCELDIAKDESGQPIVNQNGALGLFILMSGQRGSEWGVADDANTKLLAKSDFTKGRVHPCLVGSDECVVADENTDACNNNLYCRLGWTFKKQSIFDYAKELLFDENNPDDATKQKGRLEQNTATSKFMSRWIGGAAYVAHNGEGNFGSMNTGFTSDERFKDPTRNNAYFWDEMKYYQAYSELTEWMETVGLVKSSGVAKTAMRYYDEKPIDNSYEGKIARLSGMSKDRVVAVLDLFQYVAWLKNYDATALLPVPAAEPEQIQYDNGEIVAQAEKITTMAAIVYDEMRNRTVVA